MIDSISRYPAYKSFASNLRTQKLAKWIRLTESHIISELRTGSSQYIPWNGDSLLLRQEENVDLTEELY